MCGKESDGDGGAMEKKEMEAKAPGTTCRIENCQGRKRKTRLNGGFP